MKTNASFTFIQFLLLFSFSKPEFISIKITRESDPNQVKLIDPKGTFALMSETNSSMLSNLLEGNESEKFEMNFRNNEGVIYTWLCSLWIPEKMNGLIKCQVDQNVSTSSSHYFTLESGIVKFGENYIEISSADNYYFELDMKEFNVPFIYSEPQIIDLEENKDSFLQEKLAIVEKGSKSPFGEFDMNEINITIKLEDNDKYILTGEKSILPTISFITDYNDTNNIFNISDIERKTKFIMNFKENSFGEIKFYPGNCRLWKPMNDKIRLFCHFTDSRNVVNGKFNFSKTSFQYNNYTINIESDDYFEAAYTFGSISFLYSDIQYIDLDSEEDTFNIKFKYDYLVSDDEAFYLKGNTVYIPLYDYEDNKKEKEIIFSIKRNLIEQKIIRPDRFQFWSINKNYGGRTFDNVFDIIIRYNKSIEKEKITTKIVSPEQSSSKREESLAFKTESDIVPDITTDEFKMRFIDSNNVAKNYSCYLKKSYNKNFLYLFCSISNIGTFILENQKLIKEYIHYKYIFDIINENNSTSLNIVNEFGTGIVFINPNVFNYNFQEDIIIFISMTNDNKKEDILITPNEYASENETLFYYNMFNRGYIKKYTVPISFFENKKSGYFYLYHSGISEESDYVPYYEANPIYLNLPPSNLIVIRIKESMINYIGKNGIITFKTNSSDEIKNLFNESNIEDKLSLDTTVIDENKITYNATCKIWNPMNEYLRVFCQLHEDLKDIHKISLNTLHFPYNNYDIEFFLRTLMKYTQNQINIYFLSYILRIKQLFWMKKKNNMN